jgi:hypothetical protein
MFYLFIFNYFNIISVDPYVATNDRALVATLVLPLIIEH